MGLLFYIVGSVGIFVSIILLFVDYIRREPLRYNWISLLLSITLIVLAFLSIEPANLERAQLNQTNATFDPELFATTNLYSKTDETNEELIALKNKARDITRGAFGPSNGFDGKDSVIQIDYDQTEKFISITVFGKDQLTTNLIKRTMWHDVYEVLKEFVLVNGIDAVAFQIVMPVKADDGGSIYTAVMKMTFEKDTFAKIDWSKFSYEDAPIVADKYWTHRALQ